MSWREVVFEELYAIPSKNGLTRPSRVRGSGYKMINMGELFANDRIGNIDMEFVPVNDKELSTMLVEPGDLLFARQSLVLAGAGKCSLVTTTDEPTTFESHIIRVRLNREIAIPAFFHYYFKSPICRIRSIVTQGVQAGIRGNDLKMLKVHVPPLHEQQRIAFILSAYDDLIENNRRRIQLLEQAARLLYKKWFVHFRFPGHEHVKIEEGVPEGWERKIVGEVSSFISRGITPKYDDDAPGIVINQKCIRDRKVSLELARRQSKEASTNKLVRFGDVLINSTGQGTLGRVAQFFDSIENCTVDSHVTIARPAKIVPIFLYGQQISSMEDYLAVMGRGATNQTELSRETIASLPFLYPPHMIAMQFEVLEEDVVRQIQNLVQQNINLTKARDLLLPRLMNGVIAV